MALDSVRWGGLRIEPYDPDAKDADADGIVQEGSAWERPLGTRILDDLGREIARGFTADERNPLYRIVDADGNPVDYTPKEIEAVAGGGTRTTLGRLGHPSLAEAGHQTVLDTNAAAYAESLKPYAERLPADASDATRWYFEKQDLYLRALRAYEYDPEFIAAREKEIAEVFEHRDDYIFHKGSVVETPTTMHSYEALAISPQAYLGGFEATAIPKRPHTLADTPSDRTPETPDLTLTAAELERQARLADATSPALPYSPGGINDPEGATERLATLESGDLTRSRSILMAILGVARDDAPAGLDQTNIWEAEPLAFDLDDAWWDGPVPEYLNTGMTRRQLLDSLMVETNTTSLEDLARVIAEQGATATRDEFDRRADDDIIISYSIDTLLPILRTGRIKSQFETGRSHGELDPAKRADAELRQFGVPVDIADRMRPIYGHLDVREEGETISKLTGSSYGDRAEGIHIVLRPKVRARSTMTHGDSLAAGAPMPVSMKDSDISTDRGRLASSQAMRQHMLASSFSSLLNRVTKQQDDDSRALARTDAVFVHADVEGFGYSTPTTSQELADKYPSLKKYYFEAQIHGGVSTDDIAYVVIPDEDNGYTDEIMAAAAERGIPVLRHSAAVKGSRGEANAAAMSEPIDDGADFDWGASAREAARAREDALDLSSLTDAQIEARYISPRTKQADIDFRATVSRVEAKHGPIRTPTDARVALARAFPNLRSSPDKITFLDEDKLIEPVMTGKERGWVIGLLALADEHPQIAACLYDLDHTQTSDAQASAGVRLHLNEELGLPQFGFGLHWYAETAGRQDVDYWLAHMASGVRADVFSLPEDSPERARAVTRKLSELPHIFGTTEAIDLINDPRASDADVAAFRGMITARHEWGHLLDFEARLQDHGLSLSDTQDRTWLLQAFTQHAERIRPADPLRSAREIANDEVIAKNQALNAIDNAATAARTGVSDGHFLRLLIGTKDAETAYDNLSLGAKQLFEQLVRNTVSTYSRKNDWETTAEFYTAMRMEASVLLNKAQTEGQRAAVMQVIDWLNGQRDERHAIPLRTTSKPLEPSVRVERVLLEQMTPKRDLERVHGARVRLFVQLSDAAAGDDLVTIHNDRVGIQTLLEMDRESTDPEGTGARLSPLMRDRLHRDFERTYERERQFRRRVEDYIAEHRNHMDERVAVDLQLVHDAANEEADAAQLRHLADQYMRWKARRDELQRLEEHLKNDDLQSYFDSSYRSTYAASWLERATLDDMPSMMTGTEMRQAIDDEDAAIEERWKKIVADSSDPVDSYQQGLRELSEIVQDYKAHIDELGRQWSTGTSNGPTGLAAGLAIQRHWLFSARVSRWLDELHWHRRSLPGTSADDARPAPIQKRGMRDLPVDQLQTLIEELKPLDWETMENIIASGLKALHAHVTHQQSEFARVHTKTAESGSSVSTPVDAMSSELCTGYPTNWVVPIGRVRYYRQLEAGRLATKAYTTPLSTKVNRYWKDGFRLAPYDPDATDADGDGIVQEGTVWERPVGTRWVDEAGRDIARGLETPAAHPNRSLVDKDNKPVTYTPRGGSGQVSRGLGELLDQKPNEGTPQYEAPKPKPPSSALGQIGHPTIGELGAQIVAEAVAPTPPPPPKPVKKAKKPAKAKKDLSQWHGSLFSRLSRFGRDQQNEIRKGFRAQAKMTIEQATARGLEIFLNASPEARERGESWYRRVRGHLEEAGKQKRQTLEVMAGVLAATSQRMTWYNKELGTYPNWNVAMATVDLWNENQIFTITEQRMQDLLASTQNDMVAAQSKLATLTATPVPGDAKAAQARAKKIAAAEARITELQARIDKSFGLHVGQKISLHDLLLDDEKEGALVAADLLSEDVRQRAGAQVMQIPLAAALRVLSSGDIDKLRGPKIRSFADNLLQGGEGEAITIDVWMARILTGIDGIELDRGGGPGTKFRGQFDTEFLDKDGNEVGPFNIYPAFAEIVARITDLWNLRHPNEQYTAAQVQAILWETALEQGI